MKFFCAPQNCGFAKARRDTLFWQLHMLNKRHAMHAEAMTFHKGSLIIFRTFVKKLGYIKVTDNFCAE